MFIDRKIDIIKMSAIPNYIYRYHTSRLKTPANYFCEYWHADSKVYMGRQMIKNSQLSIESDGQSWKIDAIDFKTYKTVIVKTVCYWERIDKLIN